MFWKPIVEADTASRVTRLASVANNRLKKHGSWSAFVFWKKNIWLCSGVICKYIYTQFWKALKLTKTMHAYLRCGGQNSIEICSVWKVREGLPQLPELAPCCFKNREEVASQDKYCTFVDPTLQEECSTIFGGLPRPPIPWLGSLYLWLWWSLLLGWEVFGRANQI